MSRAVLETLAAAFEARRWVDIVTITDAWLEEEKGLPPQAAHFRAAALQGMGRFEEAVRWAEVATRAFPPSADALGPEAVAHFSALAGLGTALATAGLTGEAMRVYRQMLRVPILHPTSLAAKAHLRLAIKPKQWRKAWAEHEARTHAHKFKGKIPGVASWDGQATDGPVVVTHEQGIGDAVLFARWLPLVAHRSGHPVIWVGEQMFHRYMTALPCVSTCLTVEEAFEQVAEEEVRLRAGVCFVRAMSLPYLFDCTTETIPAPIAPALPRVPLTLDRPIRVGVCWEGSATAYHNFDRSLAAELAAVLWAPLPGVEWVSLQYGVESPPGAPFGPMPGGDLFATAERAASCDIVVTVDTSVFHVAASLGIPTIVMPPMTVDWRYTGWPSGMATLWYPSAVVVRRAGAQAVGEQVRTARRVVEEVVQSLRQRRADAGVT